MTPDRWARIDQLLDEALERPLAERSTFLDEVCAEDDDLRREVESLLAAHQKAEGKFLDRPALDLAARQLVQRTGHSLIGQTLGHYSVLSVLGVGGMGEVYLARDTKLERKVALKLPPPQYTSDPARIKRFEREARAASALNHPNIITIYEIGQIGNRHFIAAEFVDGQTLREMISNRGIAAKDAIEIAIQTTSALSAAHEAGIVHRDIKPENVMRRRDGYVKVLDFGLVKLIERSKSQGETNASEGDIGKTNPGAVIGTVRYMSPEQALGQEVDSRSDIFSLGVVLYELLTGAPPFKGSQTAGILDAIAYHDPAPITQIRPDLHPELERIVRRALEKDRDLRYQTAGDLRAELKRLQRELDSSPSHSISSSGSQAPAIAPGWNARLFAAAAIVVIALAAFGFVAWRWMSGDSGEPSPWLNAYASKVTDFPGEEIFPSLSPDGKSIVYARRADGDWDIYSQRVGGGNALNLTANSPGDDTHPAFSPDGEQIVFRSERDGGGVFVMGASGESVRRLSRNRDAAHPAWSPDGGKILFTEESIVDPRNRIVKQQRLWLLEVATLEERLVTTDDVAQPQWSPNGRWIVYWATDKGGQRDIWIRTISGGAPVRITNDTATDWNPLWSPDGQRIYFVSDRNGGSMRVWRVAVDQETGQPRGAPELAPTPAAHSQHISLARDGGRLAFVEATISSNLHIRDFDPARLKFSDQPTPLTQGSKGASDPDISSNGELVVFNLLVEGREDIAVIKSDGAGEPRLLTDDAHKDRGPKWSPDGQRLAFYSNRSGGWEIWLINADGSGLRQLTYTSGEDAFYPVWSPDGARLGYTTRAGKTFIIEVATPWQSQTPQPVRMSTRPEVSFGVRHWSSDANKFTVYLRTLSGGPTGVGFYSIAPERVEQLSNGGDYPLWLSDNRRLIYSSRGSLWLVDTETKKSQTLLSVQPNNIHTFSLSRDNRRLCYTLRTSEADIWILSQK